MQWFFCLLVKVDSVIEQILQFEMQNKWIFEEHFKIELFNNNETITTIENNEPILELNQYDLNYISQPSKIDDFVANVDCDRNKIQSKLTQNIIVQSDLNRNWNELNQFIDSSIDKTMFDDSLKPMFIKGE
jgi:hypothetical protein